jgi:hypothetical protein
MKAKLTYQHYGTSILIFIQGESEEAAMGQWMSLYNWGATSTEPRWVAGNVIACWSTMEKFQKYLFNLHENRLIQAGAKEGTVTELAQSLANTHFGGIERESFRSVGNTGEFYEMGVILAERPDDEYANEGFGAAMMERYIFKGE